ncbi:MAG: response regulator [Chloroflexi bacterium]|nr:MAG: response regulator [Chloroflexota bacterium]
MADVKRILVVDDHFEMLEMLRSMLEISNKDFEVLAVPSAEEGLLEFRRTKFDLLITDVRLPGMSGFELVRRVRQQAPDLPVIMITAYASTQGEREAEELGILRYFTKPLDTDAVLATVNRALYGEKEQERRGKGMVAGETAVSLPTLSADARKRLDALRHDTGANALMLCTVSGQLVYQTGTPRRIKIEQMAQVMGQSLAQTYPVWEQLGGDKPFTLQYYAGNSSEMYCANVGKDYLVAMLFDTQSRRGRIGTIWVFTQRAMSELAQLLPPLSVAESVPQQPAKPASRPIPETSTPQPQPEPKAEPAPPPVVEMVEEEPEPFLEPIEASTEELEALFGGELEIPTDTSELNELWDETDALSEGGGGGLSFEEAKRLGLIPPDLDAEGDK